MFYGSHLRWSDDMVSNYVEPISSHFGENLEAGIKEAYGSILLDPLSLLNFGNKMISPKLSPNRSSYPA